MIQCVYVIVWMFDTHMNVMYTYTNNLSNYKIDCYKTNEVDNLLETVRQEINL